MYVCIFYLLYEYFRLSLLVHSPYLPVLLHRYFVIEGKGPLNYSNLNIGL